MKQEHLAVLAATFAIAYSEQPLCLNGCECKDQQTLYCHDLVNSAIYEFFSNTTLMDGYASRLSSLTLVNCSINNLDFLPPNVLRNLLYLDLSHNQLTDFKFATSLHLMRLLVVLKLTGNQLTGIPRMLFASVPNVEDIYLDQNRIFSIDWEAFRLYKLKRLWLAHNNLLSINEHILRFTPNLEYLDLSHNQLMSAQSSSFFSARRLTELNLSHNRLQRFDYDSFLPLHQLQVLDFSYNNFSEVPTGLAQFVGVRQLNFSANPIERIRSGDFQLPVLQVIVIEFCDRLRLIESRPFVEMPNIQSVFIRNNPVLTFVSPNAFLNSNVIYEIDLENNSLAVVQFNSTTPTRLKIGNNPLECECMLHMFDQMSKHIVDLENVSCKVDGPINSTNSVNLKEFRSKYTHRSCSIQPLVPMGTEVRLTVGSRAAVYCAPRLLDDKLTWKDWNRSQSVVNQQNSKRSNNKQINLLHSISMQPLDVLKIAHNERILHMDERLMIQTAIAEDSGDYLCQVNRGGRLYQQAFKLTVQKPKIHLYSIDVGSHYVALSWNQSLQVDWTENVRLMMAVRDENNSTMRVIQLNILNPWFGYNVLRLKPEKNYTFCLFYEFIYNYSGEIFETCTTVQTLPSLSFWSSFHPSTICFIFGFLVLFTMLTCFRVFYIRFYIWHQAKARSRMNQSISGQNFISRSVSNATDSLIDHSLTYDNSAAVRMSFISNTPTIDKDAQRIVLNDATV